MPQPDWTQGPAKWAAVVILGGACLSAMAWTFVRDNRPWRLPTAPLAPPPAAAISAEPPRTPTSLSPTSTPAAADIAIKININTATRVELELLPGIGPSLASRIIDERDRAGRFKSIDDLDRVRGIGPKTIQRLRDRVVID